VSGGGRSWAASGDGQDDLVHVVAGVVRDASGRVLIAQRPAGKHLAGGWEFPGGKLGVGEGRAVGLARELREEIGIIVESARPLIRVRHRYAERGVLLDVWVVSAYRGEVAGLDGQQLRWCSGEELRVAPLLEADRPVVAAVLLPEQLVEISSGQYCIDTTGAASGARVGGSRSGNANEDVELRGVFCANKAEAAAAAGADFLVLRERLATCELVALCESVNLPVYARGITLEEAWAAGATGVNGITAR
jgi:mutator protein MutT